MAAAEIRDKKVTFSAPHGGESKRFDEGKRMLEEGRAKKT